MRWRLFIAVLFTTLSVIAMHWPVQWQPILDSYYGDIIYPQIQGFLRLLPETESFALADALWLLLGIGFILRIGWCLRKHPVRRIPLAFVITWLWGSTIYLLLMIMWGLNYQRPSLYQSLTEGGFTRELQDGHWQFALSQTNAVIDALPSDFDFCQPTFDINPDRPAAFAHSAMALANLPTSPARRIEPSAWSFYYRGIGLAGVYVPFTGEPTYNQYLFPLAKPFTMTHEYMHWTGMAFEYDADIVAYWALWLSPDPIWQYSAWLTWWRSVGAPTNIRTQLDERLQTTLQCFNDYQKTQKRWKIQQWHWQLYEQNLKAQGVSEGLKSYAMGESLALSSYQDWLHKKQH